MAIHIKKRPYSVLTQAKCDTCEALAEGGQWEDGDFARGQVVAAAVSSGWREDGGKLTCTECIDNESQAPPRHVYLEAKGKVNKYRVLTGKELADRRMAPGKGCDAVIVDDIGITYSAKLEHYSDTPSEAIEKSLSFETDLCETYKNFAAKHDARRKELQKMLSGMQGGQ